MTTIYTGVYYALREKNADFDEYRGDRCAAIQGAKQRKQLAPTNTYEVWSVTRDYDGTEHRNYIVFER